MRPAIEVISFAISWLRCIRPKAKEDDMPLFITQGRFTHDAVKGMIAKPEDRAEEVG